VYILKLHECQETEGGMPENLLISRDGGRDERGYGEREREREKERKRERERGRGRERERERERKSLGFRV